ncbi:MAG: hypothetical protein SNJ75_10745 [Gemmataceae bacterium]
MSEKGRGPFSVPGQPTDAPPGTARKVRVLMERAARREPLFHPGDNNQRPLPVLNGTAESTDTNDDLDLYDIDMAS